MSSIRILNRCHTEFQGKGLVSVLKRTVALLEAWKYPGAVPQDNESQVGTKGGVFPFSVEITRNYEAHNDDEKQQQQ